MKIILLGLIFLFLISSVSAELEIFGKPNNRTINLVTPSNTSSGGGGGSANVTSVSSGDSFIDASPTTGNVILTLLNTATRWFYNESQDFSKTLSLGNSTSGQDITLSSGDDIFIGDKSSNISDTQGINVQSDENITFTSYAKLFMYNGFRIDLPAIGSSIAAFAVDAVTVNYPGLYFIRTGATAGYVGIGNTTTYPIRFWALSANTGLIQQLPITLPTCNAAVNGSIGLNNSGHYGCFNSVWNRLY